MTEYVKLTGLDQTVAALRQLPAELASTKGGPIRYALAGAAQVIKEEIQARAPVLTGNLKVNVYMYRDRNPRSRGATERYTVGIRVGRRRGSRNRLNERLRRVGRRFAARGNAWYWWLLEFGFTHVGGKRVQVKFARPAFEDKKYAAVSAFSSRLAISVDRAVQLARQRAGG